MNNRSRNKDKAIKRYCSKINMGIGTLYVPFDPLWERIQFKGGRRRNLDDYSLEVEL